MEKKVVSSVKQQWDGVAAMLETFEALRVEERSGVDLGTLAIKQLEKYAAENDELKQSARRMKEDYASKIEQLQDEARTQRDKIHSQQHQQELEVHKLQNELTELKHKNEMLEHQLQTSKSSTANVRQRFEEQERSLRVENDQLRNEISRIAAQCQAISQERNQLRHELQQAVAAGQAMIHSQPQLPEPVATATASTRATQPVATQHSPTHQRLEMLMLLPPVMWSVDQVAEWMTLQPPQSGIHQYASSFVQANIDGDLLLPMEAGDLQTIGIANAKHRKAILAAIENLKTGGNGILSSPQNPTAELQPTKGRRGAGKPKRKVKKR